MVGEPNKWSIEPIIPLHIGFDVVGNFAPGSCLRSGHLDDSEVQKRSSLTGKLMSLPKLDERKFETLSLVACDEFLLWPLGCSRIVVPSVSVQILRSHVEPLAPVSVVRFDASIHVNVLLETRFPSAIPTGPA